MNVRTHAVACGLALLTASAGVAGEILASARPGRTVAVTIDDLPGNRAGMAADTPAALAAMTRKLHVALAAHGAPAVGFVNAGKLDVAGEEAAARAARVEVLRSWLTAGLELGNHTFSHPSLNRTELAAFQDDVERGEPVLRELLAERGLRLRWFRHPFLQVGLELPKRRACEAWLAERGYAIAPVTVDNDEWIFAAVYADALRRGDAARAAKVAAEYLAYMEGVFAFVEGVSGQLLGREIAQILLIHANDLNADHLDALLARLARRGYRFVTLESALADPAYTLPDDYVGAWGISWLHHWEVTAGKRRSPSPDPPAWIRQGYDALGAGY